MVNATNSVSFFGSPQLKAGMDHAAGTCFSCRAGADSEKASLLQPARRLWHRPARPALGELPGIGLERRNTAAASLPIDDFSRFAFTTFIWFASVQLGTILLLVPALFGGVIADEKQRKTMHYLMASRLSSAEIVLDKLAARLLHVGAFILLGLPVMSLLTLFGGVAWDYVAGAYRGDIFDHVLRGVIFDTHFDDCPASAAGRADRLRLHHRLVDCSPTRRLGHCVALSQFLSMVRPGQ